jgi:DNA-binding response OmpR family regulator
MPGATVVDLDVSAFRVVVIDDQVTNVEFLTALLERDGFRHVVGVSDPRRALDAVVAEDADLVLLDLMMPHVDGYDVLRGLRHALPGGRFLPVLVMTADATPEARRRALELGATDFLTKPVNVLEATLRIRNLLRTRHLQRACDRLERALEDAILLLARAEAPADGDAGDGAYDVAAAVRDVAGRLGLDEAQQRGLESAARRR